jgi:hypothetical protein
LLGKIQVPQTLDVIDEKGNEGKRMLKIIELNELAFTELILSIDIG